MAIDKIKDRAINDFFNTYINLTTYLAYIICNE